MKEILLTALSSALIVTVVTLFWDLYLSAIIERKFNRWVDKQAKKTKVVFIDPRT